MHLSLPMMGQYACLHWGMPRAATLLQWPGAKHPHIIERSLAHLLTLSVRHSMMKPVPPAPYASYVTCAAQSTEKLPRGSAHARCPMNHLQYNTMMEFFKRHKRIHVSQVYSAAAN